MEIIHQDKSRILIGNHEDGWITINIVLSNGHIGKLVIPDLFADILSDWLKALKPEIMEEDEECDKVETNLTCPHCGYSFVPINPPYEIIGNKFVTYCPRCLMYFEVADKK